MELKTKIFYGITVCSGVACFSLVIYVMVTTVAFFSYLFSIEEEAVARNYLKTYFSSLFATIYLSIFGLVIVIANTIALFTGFIMRSKLIIIHIIYYLSTLICGIVAIVGSTGYEAQMIIEANKQACQTFKCKLSSPYLLYRGQIIIFFICFCLFFAMFMVFFQLTIYFEESEEIDEKKSEHKPSTKQEILNTGEESNIDHNKNATLISQPE